MSERPASRESLASANAVTAAKLRDVALFGALSEEVLEHIASTLHVVTFDAGQLVFREGDVARELYVVLDGELEVTKRTRLGRDLRVAMLGPSDVVGEMSVIDLQPRSASVRALAPSRMLRVTSDDMASLYRYDLKAYTLIVLNIARDLSRRLRVTDGLLADITANVLDQYIVGDGKRQSC
jgi:CRP/FNR family cyclic AMP-dependent transcriptional regulator